MANVDLNVNLKLTDRMGDRLVVEDPLSGNRSDVVYLATGDDDGVYLTRKQVKILRKALKRALAADLYS